MNLRILPRPLPPLCAAPARAVGFTLTELLVVLAVLSLLAAVVTPVVSKARARARLAQCNANLQKITAAVLLYANDHERILPAMATNAPPGAWWWYKEQVKSYAGLTGPSSPRDTVFGCPDDRGYDEKGEARAFRLSAKHDFQSYVFNGVNLPGLPNVAGRDVSTLAAPNKTLLMMEWTAHAPLSWHRSRTGRRNAPFYNNAESVVGFADGHAGLIKIYYDGCNAAYTRDPVPGYDYKYSGD